ncbi:MULTISPECIES: glutathione S-transferase family protein [unclassified Pseudoalteromonas]|uniref:glutathione S-transferase family protein n=1 Tax=unclassified Pseudoalteromonas TaxID=194690 RepID=UPI000CF5FB6E|nr:MULTISPECIES: glutathione S-transferase family protein [unclassified Pseudoalteromonas]
MQLYGSNTSPFARRLRIWCKQHNLAVSFQHLDIFSPDGRKFLLAHSPVAKIPFLVDGEQVIYDSNVVYEYLSAHFKLPSMSWDERNQLTVINAANDSAIELLLSQRSGFDTNEEHLFFDLQKQRIALCLDALEQQVAAIQHSYVCASLFCLLDWLQFRELHDVTPYPALMAFWQAQKTSPHAQATDPRQG